MENNLPEGWKYYKVDEIKAPTSTSIAIGPFGSRMKSDCYTEQGVPVIRGTNISDTKVFHNEFVYISEEKAKEMGSSNVYDSDLVFPHRGAIGEVGIVTGGEKAHYVLSSSLMKLTPDKNIVDPLFLFYYFRSPDGKHELLKNASQVGTPGIATPLTSLKSARILLPPLSAQKSIAFMLGSLDDKIELNRQMNQTLEAMARAIFQSWFVDFDPVRAKAAGQETGLPAEIAGLFPDGFEESPLGEIPKGWRIARIGDTCEFLYGKALKEENRIPGEIQVYGSNGQVGWHNESIVTGPGIVVGRKGNPGTVKWVQTDFFPIDTTFYVSPRNSVNMHYLYFALLLANLQNQSGDSAVPGLNRNIAYQSQIVVPPRDLLDEFQNMAAPFFESVFHNSCEVRSLADLRDQLLPKLMSGELQAAKSLTP